MSKLPYMVATVGELVDPLEEEEGTGSGMGSGMNTTNYGKKEEKKEKQKAVIVKVQGRQSFYMPTAGLLDWKDMKPGELIAVNKDSYIIYEKLPPEYDSRVKAMEVDERPTEEYSDVGGLDK